MPPAERRMGAPVRPRALHWPHGLEQAAAMDAGAAYPPQRPHPLATGHCRGHAAGLARRHRPADHTPIPRSGHRPSAVRVGIACGHRRPVGRCTSLLPRPPPMAADSERDGAECRRLAVRMPDGHGALGLAGGRDVHPAYPRRRLGATFQQRQQPCHVGRAVALPPPNAAV